VFLLLPRAVLLSILILAGIYNITPCMNRGNVGQYLLYYFLSKNALYNCIVIDLAFKLPTRNTRDPVYIACLGKIAVQR